MATSPSPDEPVTADDVLSAQFTHIKKGGYDTQEVDSLLDRIAATLDRDRATMPEGSMTADDVRTAEFTQVKRGGYDTNEVDGFLDRVVAVLGLVPQVDRAQPAGAPDTFMADLAPQGTGGAPPDEYESEVPGPRANPAPPAGAVVESLPPTASGAPRLHDPEGAAQMLLAAAQQAADSLTGTATAFSEQTRREADEYALATRTEADEHAASVTGVAETQAAAIREVAADEARRAAEEARTALVDEIAQLQARRVELVDANTGLESVAAERRDELLTTLDDLRSRIAGELPAHASPSVAVESSPVGPVDVADDVDDAFAPDASDSSELEPPTDEPSSDLSEVPADPEPEPAAETQPEPAIEADSDPTDDASRSVFDLDGDEDSDDEQTSAAWLEAELDMDVAPDAAAPDSTSDLFDVEADPDWEGKPSSADAPRSIAAKGPASGDSFFDELRQADAEADALGPLDDDTDAALSAFFDADDGEEQSGRWRDRFGPGKE